METTTPQTKEMDSSGYPWVNDLKKLLMMDKYDPTEIIKYTGGFRALVGFIRSLEIQTKFSERSRILSAPIMQEEKEDKRLSDDTLLIKGIFYPYGDSYLLGRNSKIKEIKAFLERKGI